MLRNLRFVCLFLYAFPSFSALSIDQIEPGYSARYNALPSVEKADADLQVRHSFSNFLEEFGGLVCGLKLERLVGLRLIHRHFKLEKDEIMMETPRIFEGSDALVTSPVHHGLALQKKAVPSSWFISEGKLYVFETSTDLEAVQGGDTLRTRGEFFPQAQKLIEDYGFQRLMAIAVLSRGLKPKRVDHIYLEKKL